MVKQKNLRDSRFAKKKRNVEKYQRGRPMNGADRLRRCMGTLNNPNSGEMKLLQGWAKKEKLPKPLTFIVGQCEYVEVYHFQFYLEADKGLRRKDWKKLFSERAHYEKCGGNQEQNIVYVTKTDTMVDEDVYEMRANKENWPEHHVPFSIKVGAKKEQGVRKNDNVGQVLKMIDEDEEIEEIFEKNPKTTFHHREKIIREYVASKGERNLDPTKKFITILTGETGTGKSTTARKWAQKKGSVFTLRCVAGERCWFDGYQGQKSIIIDEFGKGAFPYSEIKQLLDIHPHKVGIKHSMSEFISENIFICTTVDPKNWYQGVTGPKVELVRRLQEYAVWMKFHTRYGEDHKRAMKASKKKRGRKGQKILPPYFECHQERLEKFKFKELDFSVKENWTDKY